MAYLGISGVGRTYGSGRASYQALADVNLEIERGEFVALIGHSGCGKSTLLNMIGGLDHPTAGTISIQGRAIKGPGRDRGMVFQHHALLPWLSVYGNVYHAVDAVFPQAPRKDKTGHVERFLRMVELWDHRDKKPSQISGGMKQRVSIARAFAVQPQVLLLDEPFGALDALTKSTLHEELVSLWSKERESETVVMVTHDIDEAIFLADRIVVMTSGPRATVGEIVGVPLPRPRDKRAMVRAAEYVEIKERLLYLLTDAFAHSAA